MMKIRDFFSKHIPSGSFFANFLVLISGTTLAQIIIILFTPVLTRLYTPDDYGVLSLFISISTVLSVIACGYYEKAIVLPVDDNTAARVLLLCIFFTLFVTLLVFSVVGLFHNQVANLFKTPLLAFWLWFVPINLASLGFFKAFNYWCIRTGLFRNLARRQVAQSGLATSTQIISGFGGYAGAGGLILGNLIGQCIPTFHLGWDIWKNNKETLLKNFKLPLIKEQAMRYRQFLYYGAFSELLNSVSTMLPVFMLAHFFGATVVGYYALAQKLLFLPAGLIGGSMGSAFLPRAVEAKDQGNLNETVMLFFSRLLDIVVIPTLLLTVCAPYLFKTAFGAVWVESGIYFRYLTIWFIFAFIASPISVVFDVLEKQKELLFFNTIMVIGRFVILFVGAIYGNALKTVVLFGLFSAVLYFILCLWINKMVGNKILDVLKRILLSFRASIPYILVPLVMYWYQLENWIILSVSLCFFIVYVLVNIRNSFN